MGTDDTAVRSGYPEIAITLIRFLLYTVLLNKSLLYKSLISKMYH